MTVAHSSAVHLPDRYNPRRMQAGFPFNTRGLHMTILFGLALIVSGFQMLQL